MEPVKTIVSGDVWNEDTAQDVLSVIIAAHNEEGYIADCLDAIVTQDEAAGRVEVIVAANACTDRTGAIVSEFGKQFSGRGWRLVLLNIKKPGKLNALNLADQETTGASRLYLDADVRCDPELLGQLRHALSRPYPVYATGTLKVALSKTWISRCYSRFWIRLPFVQAGAVGAGLFAVNDAGRKRWGKFPDIISDDTFVRLSFRPSERVEVPARYHWPMVEGVRNLVRVRRRQDAGVDEIRRLYPDLLQNDNKAELSGAHLFRLMCQAPLGFAIYSGIQVLVKLAPRNESWVRGR